MDNKVIFISHSTTDKAIADMLLDFLSTTGMPRDCIKCSSLPGNDVKGKISEEVRGWIRQSVVNIAILSHDYYKSAYCLNEAGILWYLKDVPVIPIALPEIDHNSMVGFLNSEYKLRRLDSDTDIAEIYDTVRECVGVDAIRHSVIAAETAKLKEKYEEFCGSRVASFSVQTDESTEYEDDDGCIEFEEEDVWDDGYHEVHDREGNLIEKGQFLKGTLVDGTSYNIILKIYKDRVGVDEREPTEEESEEILDGFDYDVWKEKLMEEPIPKERIKEEPWHYSEFGRCERPLMLSFAHRYMEKLGLEYFYVVDKKVRLEGDLIQPTFTNFRTMESFLAENDPDGLKYLKTGRWGFEEVDSAEVELD